MILRTDRAITSTRELDMGTSSPLRQSTAGHHNIRTTETQDTPGTIPARADMGEEEGAPNGRVDKTTNSSTPGLRDPKGKGVWTISLLVWYPHDLCITILRSHQHRVV